MVEQSIEIETKLYLYDLKNAAQEHGFKTDDSWDLHIVAEEEKLRLQRAYFPTIITRLYPGTLLEVFHLAKLKLNQSLNKEEAELDIRAVLNNNIKYLVAFNPKRERT